MPAAPLLENEKLEVNVRCDTPAHGHPWIEVEDNGVGMTSDAIKQFLTQIGQSYYKSPSFLRERELMKRHGLLCTIIAQFGIGFLSSFMLAEEIEIETRAAAKDGALESGWRVRILGPHGIISLYPLDRVRIPSTGTRVRLRLRENVKLKVFEKEWFQFLLRSDFYDSLSSRNDEAKQPPTAYGLEPASSIARCLLWPLFPVKLYPPRTEAALLNLKTTVRIDTTCVGAVR